MIEYQRKDLVCLSKTKFEKLSAQLWFKDNTFVISEVNDGGVVLLKELDESLSISEIQPIPIKKNRTGNIYYDPIIAASIVGYGDEIPVHSTDYSYFMDSFKRITEENGTTLFAQVEQQGFKYVHELQHWLRERYGSDDLKIHHELISQAEDQARKLWKLRDSLLEIGVSSYRFLYELANMLYLKWLGFYDEKAFKKWKELELATGDELLDKYQRNIQQLNQDTRIYSASVLGQAIREVSKCAFQENIAEVFDQLLQENSKMKDGGGIQGFTPQVLVELLVELVQPQLYERWHDPAAGFSGFLVEINKYLQKNNDYYHLLSNEEKAFQFQEALSGMEMQKEIARIGFCNTRFHGLHCDLKIGDSLESIVYQQYDGIISEPPIQAFLLTGDRKDEKSIGNRRTNFVDLILNSLSNQAGSRAVLLLPEFFLNKTSSVYNLTRKRLVEDYNLHTILRLPRGIYPGSNISMCAIFVNQQQLADNKLLVYDMQLEKLKPEQLQDSSIFNSFIKVFHSRIPNKNSRIITLEELRNEDFKVTFGKNGNEEKSKMEAPTYYLNEANKVVRDIRSLLSKIEKEVNG